MIVTAPEPHDHRCRVACTSLQLIITKNFSNLQVLYLYLTLDSTSNATPHSELVLQTQYRILY